MVGHAANANGRTMQAAKNASEVFKHAVPVRCCEDRFAMFSAEYEMDENARQ
jgi:hypothetical protein